MLGLRAAGLGCSTKALALRGFGLGLMLRIVFLPTQAGMATNALGFGSLAFRTLAVQWLGLSL